MEYAHPGMELHAPYYAGRDKFYSCLQAISKMYDNIIRVGTVRTIIAKEKR
jgi:hypothetical protein